MTRSVCSSRGSRGFLIFLVAFCSFAGELALAGHGAWLDHAAPRGTEAELLESGCSLCDFEAARPVGATPSALCEVVTRLVPETPLAPELRVGPRSVALADAAAPRAPPTA